MRSSEQTLPETDAISRILREYRVIAIVGLSRDPSKYSYEVAGYLKSRGYQVIPINPSADEILGEKCYRSLLTMPEGLQRTVEVVDIFRPSQDVPPIVAQAVELKRRFGRPYVVWMQLGIENENAAQLARENGMEVVMNACMMVQHQARAGKLHFLGL
ncbi:MAG: CoA-binding protein [Candidatus Bathyarchaeia archaeon]